MYPHPCPRTESAPNQQPTSRPCKETTAYRFISASPRYTTIQCTLTRTPLHRDPNPFVPPPRRAPPALARGPRFPSSWVFRSTKRDPIKDGSVIERCFNILENLERSSLTALSWRDRARRRQNLLLALGREPMRKPVTEREETWRGGGRNQGGD